MNNFLIRLRNFLIWKIEEFSKFAVKQLTKLAVVILKPEAGSFKERKVGIFVHCLIYYPVLRVKSLLAVNLDVEDHYDNISGSYIQNLTKNDKPKWGVVNGHAQQSTYAQYCIDGMHERMSIMEEHGPFTFMLEVGAGELTTYSSLVDVMTLEKPEFHGIDLSLNRLRHGRAFAKSQKIDVSVVKASAFALPYPDNSFDVVFTSHCLEWMPKNMFKQAVDEICRVSKQHVFLFEPTYEYSSFLQKMKMRTHNYMRGLIPYLKQKNHIEIVRSSVLKYSYNVFNQTSCHHLVVQTEDNSNDSDTVSFACTECKAVLDLQKNSYFCYNCRLGYPIFDDIPVLDRNYAFGISRITP